MAAARRLFPAALLVVGFACAAAWPLATYAVTLALFGLPHVLYELRYVDGRFSSRLSLPLWTVLFGLGVIIMASRALFAAAVLPRAWQSIVELSLLAVFAAVVVPTLSRRGAGWGAAGAAFAVGVAVLAWRAPALSLVCFALIHNATPIGFLWERARDGQRLRVGALAVAVYLLVPLLFVAGLGDGALSMLGLGWRDGAPLRSVGDLSQHIGVYVPTVVEGELARRLFTGAVVAQLLHYHATIFVLPRLAARAGDARPRAPWPRRFALLVAVPAALLAVFFAVAFKDARALYGVPAAFHAWIEVPLLLLALTSSSTSASRGLEVTPA
jgi:hypothetical protein